MYPAIDSLLTRDEFKDIMIARLVIIADLE